ncbi:FHA domain-containing protein [bacterium D16-54]|nr:FHA domain-containing protein [bacterium D16-54]
MNLVDIRYENYETERIKEGMKLRCLLTGVLFTAGMCAFGMVSSADENPSLEQVYVNMPEVTAYGWGIGEDVAEVYLGKEKLELVENVPFSESGQPVYYYVLLDVSNSMPEAYFDDIKQSIQTFEGTLRSEDRMALYTFGEQVELKLPEEHSQEDTLAVMETIDNVDNKTLLFEAISMAADRAEQVPWDVCQRKVLIVISDGEDFTIGKTVAQEAQENLKRKGIPAYAYGIQDTARENINNFGEFARTSGGQLVVFGKEEAGVLLDGFAQEMDEIQVLKLQASSNIASNSMETFTIKTGSNQTITRDVLAARHMEDVTAPTILRVDKIAENQVKLEFSEPVKGADTAAAYMVTWQEQASGDDKKVAAVAGVSVSIDNANEIFLTFTNDLKPGKYTISCTNIYDLSMEGNPVSNTAEFEIEAPVTEEIPAEPTKWEKLAGGLKERLWILLVIGAALAAAIVVVVMKKRKDSQVESFETLETPQEESSAVSNSTVSLILDDDDCTRRLFDYPEMGLKTYQLELFDLDSPDLVYQVNMTDTITIGRSRDCMVCISNNRTMSGHHCEIVLRDGRMYLRDLDSKNGTFLNENPNRITEAELKSGSIIGMGSARLRVQVRQING